MTAFIATHRVDVLRGASPDAYGDPADADVTIAHEIPCAITESSRTAGGTSRRTSGPVTGTPRTVRTARARFAPGVALLAGDRLRDVVSSVVYVIVDVGTPTDLVGRADVVCFLTRVTPAG